MSFEKNKLNEKCYLLLPVLNILWSLLFHWGAISMRLINFCVAESQNLIKEEY